MTKNKNFYKEWKGVCKKVLKNSKIRYARIAYKGKRANCQLDWASIRNHIKMLFTAAVFEILRKTPPCALKNIIYRMFGVKIGKDVAIAYNVLFDPLYPELITVEDGVMIGSDCEISSHEFAANRFSIGRVIIGKNAMISAYNVIGCGRIIGENAVTGLYSFVNKDIPSNEFWAGIPIKEIKKLPKGGLKAVKDLEIVEYD